MKSLFLSVIFMLSACASFAQNKQRPIEALINSSDSGWVQVQAWIAKAKNKVEVLPVTISKAKDALYKTQVTTRSPMGAVIYHTGGLLIDNGWIRILGSGNTRLTRDLPGWNKGKAFDTFGAAPGFLLVADDVIGGFYLLNGGALGDDRGKIYYWAPDNLQYEPLGLSYTEFLMFCFNNDLNEFYATSRWPGWEKEVPVLTGDEVFNFFPYLFTKEGKDISKSTKRIIPVEEQYQFSFDMRKQIGLGKGNDK